MGRKGFLVEWTVYVEVAGIFGEIGAKKSGLVFGHLLWCKRRRYGRGETGVRQRIVIAVMKGWPQRNLEVVDDVP